MNGFQKSLDRKIDAARKRAEAEKAKASAPTAGLTIPEYVVYPEFSEAEYAKFIWGGGWYRFSIRTMPTFSMQITPVTPEK